MYNFIRHSFVKKHPTGVLHDIRPDEDKKKDWKHEEIASSPVISYVTKEKAYKNSKIYPVFNQGGESSCVGHGSALEHAIYNLKKDFKGSPEYVYRNRLNYPAEGMFGADSYGILSDKGICQYSILPTQKDEKLANALVITPEMDADAEGNKIPGYFTLNNISFDSVAALSSKGKSVKIFIDATYKEWAKDIVKPTDTVKHGYAPVCHCIVVLPNTVFKDDEDYVIIQDSAWFGGMYIRQVSRSFFDAGRVWFAAYITEVLPAVPGKKPKHTFVLGIKYGERSEEVKALQDCLIHEGLLSSDCSTGYFGGMTLKAVKLFQSKYASDILTPIGLTEPTGNVGIKTVNKLNQLYS